jgi:aldehyde dehydrogenase (NAD+)
MSYPTYHNLIGGQWLPAASGKTILNLNPADHSDVVGAFPSSHAEDEDRAVAAAKKAFVTWRLVPAPSGPRYWSAPASCSRYEREITPGR